MGIHGQKSMKILVLMSGRYWQRSCSWWSQGLLAKRLKHLMKLMSTKRSGLKQPESHHFSDAWGWQPPNTGGAMYFLLRFAIWCYQFIAYHIDFVIFYSPQVQGRPFCNMPNFLGNTNLDLNINLYHLFNADSSRISKLSKPWQTFESFCTQQLSVQGQKQLFFVNTRCLTLGCFAAVWLSVSKIWFYWERHQIGLGVILAFDCW